MEKQKCYRCKGEEDIPTYQYVKFDMEICYLCKSCWDNLRKWFYGHCEEDAPKIDEAA